MADGRTERTIENDTSSSNLVVKGDEGGLSITLDPMEHAVTKLDVYEEELGEFIGAVVGVALEAGHEVPVLLSRDAAEVVLMVLEEDLDQLEPASDEAWLGEYPGQEEVETVAEVHAAIMRQVTEGP